MIKVIKEFLGHKVRKDHNNAIYRDVMLFVDETARRTSEIDRRGDVTAGAYKHKECYSAFPESSMEYS